MQYPFLFFGEHVPKPIREVPEGRDDFPNPVKKSHKKSAESLQHFFRFYSLSFQREMRFKLFVSCGFAIVYREPVIGGWH